MKPGKLTPEELARYVFPRCGTRRPEVLVHAAYGQDAAVVDFGDEVAVLSTDPITGAGERAGWLAVHVACNDIAVSGAPPVAVLITLLLAPGNAVADAAILMGDAHQAATELAIEICGGHSEVVGALPRSLAVVTALGRARRDRYVTTAGARPGDVILLTKWAGLEGTAVLANDFAAFLDNRVATDTIERARRLIAQVSVVPEALAASEAGVSAMHDPTEGGVLGGLAELAGAAGVGIRVDLDRVPVLPETRGIAEAFGIDPFCLVSSGALLIATAHPDEVIRAVRDLGVPITPIGEVVDGPSELIQHGSARDLVAPERDALWDAIQRGAEV